MLTFIAAALFTSTLGNGFHRITETNNQYLYEEFFVYEENWEVLSCLTLAICDPNRDREFDPAHFGYAIEDGRYTELWGGGNTAAHRTPIHVDLKTGQLSLFDLHSFDFVPNRMLDITYEVFKPGDSTLDGRFNSRDLVEVFAAGTYETERNAFFFEGDWNLDRRFNSSDLIAAFQSGGYENSATSVPEPSMIPWALLGLLWFRRCP